MKLKHKLHADALMFHHAIISTEVFYECLFSFHITHFFQIEFIRCLCDINFDVIPFFKGLLGDKNASTLLLSD